MVLLWTKLFLQPLYNGLIFLLTLIPGAHLALAVILLTIIVRLILFPFAKKSLEQQIIQQKLQPKIAKIKIDHPEKKEQAEKIMELYKEHKSNPFSGCLLVLIQLPVILALYRVFLQGLETQTDLLYKGLELPSVINEHLFSIISLSEQSIILAVLTGVAQFAQLRLSGSMKKEPTESTSETEQDMATIMQKNMKMFLPIMVGAFAYFVPAAVALYWFTSNVFLIGQELYIRKIDTSHDDQLQQNV